MVMGPYRVAITARTFDRGGVAFSLLQQECRISFMNSKGRHLSEDEIISALKDADAVIAGTEKFTPRILDMAQSLRVISRIGVGTDNIDTQFAQQRGIAVYNTPDSPSRAVAEHTIGLLFSAAKRIPAYNKNMREGLFITIPGLQVSGKSAGIIGLGRIGRQVASLLSCLGCHIGFFDSFIKSGSIVPGWQQYESLEDLVRSSDIISIHAAAGHDSAPLLDRHILNLCRKNCIIINTSRGSLLDETALLEGLDSGQIFAAGLDVFRNEPYNGPLLRHPAVIATPHVASNTVESRRLMEMEAVRNIITSKGGQTGL